MSSQIQITGETKVKSLTGVLVGTSGVVSSLNIDGSLGIPQLDVNGKIIVSQLPNSVMEYKGTWDASTNTPTLVNGTGNQGDVYLCNVAGTVNFGAGAIAFFVGDQVIYSGSIWQRASGTNGTVTSVAVTESGDSLNITGSPITTSGTINIGFNGTNLQYINGAGDLTTFPTLSGYVTSVTGTAPVVSSGGTTPAISMAAATTSVNGYLASADFTTFNNKQNAITLTTTGTTGAATLVGATLNIPNYGSALTGYVPYTGATQDVDLGAFKLNAQSLHIKGTAGNGHLGLKHQSASATASANEVSLFADVNGDLGWQNGNLYLNKFITSANTANRSYTFPNATGTVALTSDISYPVTSVFGRTGAVVATSGDYTTTLVTEGTNLYYTDVRARASNSFVAGSGAYNSTTGVITIPTNNNQITNGAGYTTNVGTVTSVAATGGTGISISGSPITTSGTITITNTAPDQTVALTASTGISISGTYPNFTITNTSPSSGGTVTSVAALTLGTSGTDLSSTVATSTTTPVITLNVPTASATNRGALSSADWSTFNGKESVLTFSSPLVRTTNTISIPAATTSVNGYLTSTDWTTFNNKTSNTGTVTSVGLSSATSGVTIGSTPVTTSGTITIAIATATTSQNGLLSSTDWTTFNNKQGTITLTTTGTSGAATFSANTLNIPNYGSALSGYLPLTGGTLTGALSGTSATFSDRVFSSKVINSATISNAPADASFLLYAPTTTNYYGGIIGWAEGNIAASISSYDDGSGGALGLSFATGNNTSISERLKISSTGAATFSSSIAATSATFSNTLTVSMANYPQLILNSSNSNGALIRIQEGGTTNAFIGHNTQINNLEFSANGTNTHLTIASTGAATFSSTLQAGTGTFLTTNTTPLILQTTAGNCGIQILTSATTHNWLVAAQYSAANTFEITPSTAVGGQTYSTPVFKITNGGAATFSSSVTANILNSTSTGSTQIFLKSTGGGANRDWQFQTNESAAGDLSIMQSTTAGGATYATKVTISPTGNVLIGSADTGYKLNVNGSMYVSGSAVYAGGVTYSSTQTFNGLVYLNSTTYVASGQGITWKGSSSTTYDFSISNSGTVPYILSGVEIDLNAPIGMRYGLIYTFKGNGSASYNVLLSNSGIAADQLTMLGGLRMDTTTAGFIPPKMTTTQKNALPASVKIAGCIVYDTTSNLLQAYNGSTWNNLW